MNDANLCKTEIVGFFPITTAFTNTTNSDSYVLRVLSSLSITVPNAPF